jgi:anti-sigma regulatory factor (Ser/Thr protein kinase)
MTVHSPCSHPQGGAYRHEALFYSSADEFMQATVPFIRDAVQAEEPILVVLAARKIDALREALNGDAAGVQFADMSEVGTNPARIIPAWTKFVGERSGSGRRLRGIGEPIWAGRSEPEMAECQRHEALLNVCFDDPDFWLLCPYDASALDEAVLAEARRNHPYVADVHRREPSASYPGPAALAAPFDEPLSEPPANAEAIAVEGTSLPAVRGLAGRRAAQAGLSRARSADFVLAVSELAANSLRHGGGRGSVAIWQGPDALICDVRDGGRIENPLAGRVEPSLEADNGRGLWIANQLCELVQIRTLATGNVVRVHMRLG